LFYTYTYKTKQLPFSDAVTLIENCLQVVWRSSVYLMPFLET